MQMSRVETNVVGDVTVAICRDMKLNDDLIIQEWGDQLLEIIEKQNCKKLLVNFERVLFMSSSALRVLITLSRKAKDAGSSLVLCEIDDNIMEAFRITRLDTVFTIRKTEEEAIRTLALLEDIPPQAR